MRIEIETRARYYEVVCQLIFDYGISSVVKVIFIALSIINLENFYEGTSKKYGLIEYMLSGVKMGIEHKRIEITYILDILKLLEKGAMVEIKNNIVKVQRSPNYEKNNSLLKSPLIQRALLELEKISDEDLVKELIEYV